MWTARQVEERYEEAVETQYLLRGDGPSKYHSSLPEHIRERDTDFDRAGARADLERSARGVATAAAIDRFDEVVSWNVLLTRRECKLVWGKAELMVNGHTAWVSALARRGKWRVTKQTVRNWHKRAISKVVKHLTEN